MNIGIFDNSITFLRRCKHISLDIAYMMRHFPSLVAEKKRKRIYQRALDPNTEKLILFFFPPGRRLIAGGLFSLLNIAQISRELESCKDWQIQICYQPNTTGDSVYRFFPNEETILSFTEVMQAFPHVRQLLIHVPEYIACAAFSNLSVQQEAYLRSVTDLHINILNQNIRCMPSPEELMPLRKLTPTLTQTTAHTAYSTQKNCDDWGFALHYLSAHFTQTYSSTPYAQKENIICYSPDPSPIKKKVLHCIHERLPQFKMQKIHNMSYAKYLELIKRSKFCITFGEGMDGYFIEPHMCGSISFAIYNNDFFSKKMHKQFRNVYPNSDLMCSSIANDIIYFNSNPHIYDNTSLQLQKFFSEGYVWDEFKQRIESFYLKQYTYTPTTKRY